MNRVFISAEEVPLPGWSGQLNAYSLKVLDEINKDNRDLSVLLCGDRTIQNLNSQYRNRDESTDVLSFELGVEEPGENGTRSLPGDVVISLETLRKNARLFNVSEDEELRRLLIHGILHLCGMDHKTNDDTEPMLVKQESILEKLREDSILPKEGSLPGGEK
jgi:probable rRNA maturation factor